MSIPKWHDLDAATSFGLCGKSLQSRDNQNFAVSFNTIEAHCALDLTSEDINNFLQNAEADQRSQKTRWVNFWAGECNVEAIGIIARRYGMSSRLASQLCAARAGSTNSSSSSYNHTLQRQTPTTGATSTKTSGSDLEKTAGRDAPSKEAPSRAPKLPGFGDVVNDLWHFCSVHRDPKYLYVGFNALFNVPGVAAKQESDTSKPAGLRTWMSLLLCHDGTVVSIFEKPPPDIPAEYIISMRYNVLNIFRQLSKLQSSSLVDTLMQVSVRPFISADTGGTTDAEAAGLLFYYLFDDWRTTYSLITRRDHPYRDKLAHIREEMFDTADMDLVKSLDLVGRQLTVLKLIYQSYELIIQRILRHFNVHDPGLQSTLLDQSRGSLLDQRLGLSRRSSDNILSNSLMPDDGNQSAPAFSLPLSAAVRFERLLDRVRLYALTEIEECLKEKDSLVFMNFNLVALKESQAVEKLTRTTILLAKATILFLPVSLMTGYFSVQVSGIENLYSLKTYWLCFLVVVVASIIGLVVFGVTADRVEGRTAYKSLTRMFWDKMRRKKSKRQ